MFINKADFGDCIPRTNLCGRNLCALRKKHKMSQKQLTTKLELYGMRIDKNAIQKIEAGKRFVTDIELYHFALCFQVPLEELIDVDFKIVTPPEESNKKARRHSSEEVSVD